MPREWRDVPVRLRDRVVDTLQQQRAREEMFRGNPHYPSETPAHEAWDAAIELLTREGDGAA